MRNKTNAIEKIIAVHESYSVHPGSYRLCKKIRDMDSFTFEETPHEHDVKCLDKIELQFRQVGTNQGINLYVGYNYNGDRVFEWPQAATNVELENTYSE